MLHFWLRDMSTENGNPKTSIVLAEPDSAHRAAMTAYLEEGGFTVQQCAEALDALKAVHESRPDLLVIADGMVLRAGRGAIPTVRRTAQGQTLPIVVTGAAPGPSDDSADADYYLREPYQLSHLLGVIRGLRDNGKLVRRSEAGPLAVEQASQAVPERGKLNDTPFSTVFGAYWTAGATGVVALKAGSTLRRVDFLHGFPVAARSNLVTEHLLRYLLRLGFITPDVYRRLLPRTQEPDWDPAEVLIESGAISRTTLAEAERKLVREVVVQCFKWSGAAFRFSPKIIPAKHRDTVQINPFEVYISWLRDPSTAAQLSRKVSHLSAKGLKATPALSEHRHFLRAVLDGIPSSVARFDGRATFADIVDRRGKEDVHAVLVALVELGVVKAIKAEGRTRRRMRGMTTMGDAGRKFERIRLMVEEDQARVARARNAFQVLGLSGGAGRAEVTARFQRFSRFYRPENFERIGDEELIATSRELMAAFRNAATEVLGKAPAELPFSGERRSGKSSARSPSVDDQVLAEVFFDDGNTYLKLGDNHEALSHFKRSTGLVPNSPKFLAYTGWCIYLVDKKNAKRVAEAKQTLLSVLKLDSRNDRALYFLGCLYEDAGRADRAVDCWKKAVKLNTGNYDAQAALRRVGQ